MQSRCKEVVPLQDDIHMQERSHIENSLKGIDSITHQLRRILSSGMSLKGMSGHQPDRSHHQDTVSLSFILLPLDSFLTTYVITPDSALLLLTAKKKKASPLLAPNLPNTTQLRSHKTHIRLVIPKSDPSQLPDLTPEPISDDVTEGAANQEEEPVYLWDRLDPEDCFGECDLELNLYSILQLKLVGRARACQCLPYSTQDYIALGGILYKTKQGKQERDLILCSVDASEREESERVCRIASFIGREKGTRFSFFRMMCQRVETGTVVVAALLIVLALVSADTACRDSHPSCKTWANRGECYKNRGYMHIHCAQSCDQCVVQDEKCKDFHEQCPAWASNNECDKNYDYMRKSCPRACTFCQPANDHRVPHVDHSIVDTYWEKFRTKYPGLSVVHG
ncbi:uncharacterized protein LOC134781719 [Penaeus indicus]|uniref:uncharacterized protein LOC134781719 n=1 Tax=Penaeus indicus TaxID=29960 RepID=UPI00300CB98C